jgi:hypothetical protein
MIRDWATIFLTEIVAIINGVYIAAVLYARFPG